MADNFADIVVGNALANHEAAQEVPQMPAWATVLENFPTAPAVAGNYGRRGSNTILRGSRDARFGSKATTRSNIRQSFMNNVRPFSRFTSQTHLAGNRMPAPGATNVYQPFYTAEAANYVDRSVRGAEQTRLARMLGRGGDEAARTAAAGEERLMAGGAYSRISAAGKVGNMSAARFERVAGRQAGLNSMLSRMGYNATEVGDLLQNQGATQRALLTGGGGRATGVVGGYLSAFTEGGFAAGPRAPGGVGPRGYAATRGMDQYASRGFNRAATMAADLGIEARGTLTVGRIGQATRNTMRGAGMAGKAAAMAKGGALAAGRTFGMAIPGLNVALTAWMAYDLAKMGTSLTGVGGRALKSFRGDINKPVMGSVFRDSEAAMTSRSRGVQAIQNSRLNARSVLGSEAASMSAHFG